MANVRTTFLGLLFLAALALVSWSSFFGYGSSRLDTERDLYTGVILTAAKLPDLDRIRRSIRPIAAPRPWRHIIIHHSAVEKGGMASFRRYHLERGWDDVAYHFVIRASPGDRTVLEISRRWRQQAPGAHAGDNAMNDDSIGVCVTGDFSQPPPVLPNGQRILLDALLEVLQSRLRIPHQRILLHREVARTECPGDFFPIWSVEPLGRRWPSRRPISPVRSGTDSFRNM